MVKKKKFFLTFCMCLRVSVLFFGHVFIDLHGCSDIYLVLKITTLLMLNVFWLKHPVV